MTAASRVASVHYRVEAADVSAILTDIEGTAKCEDFRGVRLLLGAERSGWRNFDAGVRDASPDFDCEPTRSDDRAYTWNGQHAQTGEQACGTT